MRNTSISKHPYYTRWNGMIQRCYNQKDDNYKSYGAKGITVAEVWDRRNPNGSFNFIVWLEEQIAALPEHKQTQEFSVVRRNLTEAFSPDNCFISTNLEVSQRRCTTTLSFELVVTLRRYKKENQKTRLAEMCKLFGIGTIQTLSRCLVGVSWANVNAVEPPLPPTKEGPRKKMKVQTEFTLS